jgi:hypothetical protein
MTHRCVSLGLSYKEIFEFTIRHWDLGSNIKIIFHQKRNKISSRKTLRRVVKQRVWSCGLFTTSTLLEKILGYMNMCINLVQLACLHHKINEYLTSIPKILILFLRRFRKLAKRDCYLRHVCASVCLSPWDDSDPNGGIFIKYDIWRSLVDLSRRFKFE